MITAPSPYLQLSERETQRFWWNVNASEDADGCWDYGRGNPESYGKLSVKTRQGGRKELTATRVVFALLHGELVPDGMVLMHRCDRPCCVNPAHLRLATQLENVTDMWAKDRQNLRKKQYLARKNGHM